MNERVSWEEIMTLVDQLAQRAEHDEVPPKDGATLVRMLERFNRQLAGTANLAGTQAAEPKQTLAPKKPRRKTKRLSLSGSGLRVG